MRPPADSDESIDWSLTTWEGSRREQLRRWAELPLARTIAALEEMEGLTETLRRAPSSRAPAGGACPGVAAVGPPGAVSRSMGHPDVRATPAVSDLVALSGAPFWKMSGGGNDFIVFDNRPGWFPKGRPEVVAALCARGKGVGADAVLLLERASGPDADFRMTYYNADGSEAPMCGNGALCIARLGGELGLGRSGEVAFETGAGLYRAALFADTPSRVRLQMRDPRDIRPSLPEIEVLGYDHAGFADTGTPHLVVIVPDVTAVDVVSIGRALRVHPLFQPHGLNVNFVSVLAPDQFAIRIYERGVEAETLSCGTGAVAASILAHLWGLIEPPVVVHPPGGFDLIVRFAGDGAAPPAFRDVTLEGDARIVYEGRLRAGQRS